MTRESIGGKADHLIRLRERGYAVPPWCVIAAGEKPDPEAIGNWLRLHRGPFIVRSSMVGEDGEQQSFAGQLESFPNLRAAERVLWAIAACRASAGSERMRAYQKGQPAGQVAVIVQEMVNAEVSGVLFTADPKDGCRTRFLISATYGAGEAVVGGHYDCDEFAIDTATGATKRRIARKARKLEFAEEGLTPAPVADGLMDKPSLDDTQIQALVAIGKDLSLWQDRPLDIEWVFAQGRFWLVQMRPITNLGRDHSAQNVMVFDNSNIQESFNGLTLPLTFSFASESYFKVYRQIMEVMGFSQAEVGRHDRRHQQMLALVKGRVYYNIKSWYEGLLFLPSFGRNKEDMERMMGLERPVDLVTDLKLTRWQKLARLPAMIALLVRLSWAFLHMDRHFYRFRRNFNRIYTAFPRSELRWMNLQQLFALHEDLKVKVLGHWHAPIINDFYTMMMAGRVRRALKKVGCEERLPDLLAGEELESTQPTKRLVEIAEHIKADPHLRHIVMTAGEKEILAAIDGHAQVGDLCTAYCEKYGDRVAGELKLETETLRQDRGFLTRILKAYAADERLNVATIEENQRYLRHQAESEIYLRLPDRFQRDLNKFRKAVRLREAMRLDRARSFGMFRSLYLEMGRKLAEQGHLRQARDIFYLTLHELDDFLHAKACFESLADIVTTRLHQYDEWAGKKIPAQIVSAVPVGAVAVEVAVGHGHLRGLGCYPGRIEGEVFVCNDPAHAPDLRGKILVAERTDPGWTPLFLQAEALLVERGSQLSHSAVVARELGLPTIVNVPGLCAILQTGDRVAIDGQAGTIEILPARAREIEL